MTECPVKMDTQTVFEATITDNRLNVFNLPIFVCYLSHERNELREKPPAATATTEKRNKNKKEKSSSSSVSLSLPLSHRQADGVWKCVRNTFPKILGDFFFVWWVISIQCVTRKKEQLIVVRWCKKGTNGRTRIRESGKGSSEADRIGSELTCLLLHIHQLWNRTSTRRLTSASTYYEARNY